MTYLKEFIFVASIHLLALMSPGPDFIITVKNGLTSRKAGVFTALGLALGMMVHVSYCLLGIAVIISRSIVIYSTIKTLGAIYLIYLGVKALKGSPKILSDDNSQSLDSKLLTPGQAIKMGFLNNILNPKVTVFFLALFTQVIHVSTPKYIQILYGLEMMLMTFVWFSAVSFMTSTQYIKNRFPTIQKYLEKTMGALLIALGLKIVLSKR